MQRFELKSLITSEEILLLSFEEVELVIIYKDIIDVWLSIKVWILDDLNLRNFFSYLFWIFSFVRFLSFFVRCLWNFHCRCLFFFSFCRCLIFFSCRFLIFFVCFWSFFTRLSSFFFRRFCDCHCVIIVVILIFDDSEDESKINFWLSVAIE